MEEKFDFVLFCYSRGQALEDGLLVDVTSVASEAGIRFPVALTRAVWHECVNVPAGVECQDEQGRLWDVLCMLYHACVAQPYCSTLQFRLHVRNDNRPGTPPLLSLKASLGPDDYGSPCITVMMPDED